MLTGLIRRLYCSFLYYLSISLFRMGSPITWRAFCEILILFLRCHMSSKYVILCRLITLYLVIALACTFISSMFRSWLIIFPDSLGRLKASLWIRNTNNDSPRPPLPPPFIYQGLICPLFQKFLHAVSLLLPFPDSHYYVALCVCSVRRDVI